MVTMCHSGMVSLDVPFLPPGGRVREADVGRNEVVAPFDCVFRELAIHQGHERPEDVRHDVAEVGRRHAGDSRGDPVDLVEVGVGRGLLLATLLLKVLPESFAHVKIAVDDPNGRSEDLQEGGCHSRLHIHHQIFGDGTIHMVVQLGPHSLVNRFALSGEQGERSGDYTARRELRTDHIRDRKFKPPKPIFRSL